MPTPNYAVSPTPPTTPGQTGDLWFDTTNQALNVWTTTTAAGAQGWLPMTTPVINAALNASAIPTGRGAFTYMPAVVGSLGASLANPPVGQVALCFDVVGKRIYAIGSGGTVTGSVLFA